MESDLSDYAVIVKNIPDKMTNVRARLVNFIGKEIADEQGKPY